MKLAHFGTFDIENYGDLLFPRILERRVADLAPDIVFMSPRGGAPVWEDCVATQPPEAAPEFAGDLAGIVLGGGNLIHADAWNADLYDTGGPAGLLAYPRLWLGAAQLAATSGAPLAWNAPGVPGALPSGAAPLLAWSVGASAYVSVRDRSSARRLTQAAPAARPQVVPDPALEVARLWPAEHIDDAYADAFRSRLAEPPATSLAIHLNSRYVTEPPRQIASRLDKIAKQLGATPILIALGPCHGDVELAERVASHMAPAPLVVAPPRSLREAAGVIARSVAYVGSSLHGMVTACSFGVPGLVVADEDRTGLRKFSGFLEQFGLGGSLLASWSEVERKLPEVLSDPPGRWERIASAAETLLDAHWQRIAGVIEAHNARPPRRSGQDRLAELAQIAAATPPAFAPILADVAWDLRRTADKDAATARRTRHERRLLEDTLAEHERASRDTERRLESAERDLARASAELDKAGLERQDLARRLESVQHERSEFERRSTTAEEQLGELQRRLAERTEQAETSKAHLRDALEAARRDAASLHTTVSAQVAHHEEVERDLRRALGAADERLAQIRDSLERRETQARAADARLRAQLTRSEGTISTLRNVAAAQAATLRRAESDLRAELASTADELRRTQVLLTDAEVTIAELSTEAETARDHVASLRREAEAREHDGAARAARWDAEIAHAAARIQDLEGSLARAEVNHRSELTRLGTELASERDSSLAAHDALETISAQLAELSRRLAVWTTQLANVRADVERARQSRSWRWGHRFFLILRRLALRGPLHATGSLDSALVRLSTLEENLSQLAPAASRPSLPRPRRRKRLKISVICWDMAHNPLTRGNLLAEVLRDDFNVEIIGGLFEKYGKDIWQPLRDAEMPMRTFPGRDLPEHFKTMQRVAEGIDGDVIYVSKPRMPSYGLGLLAKELRNRPLILDSDDRELSFFGSTAGITLDELVERRETEDFWVPYGETWTGFFDSLIPHADHLTVSNDSLEALYGGTVIPHVRDERVFDPRLYDRDAARARFGLSPEQKIILFAGTPRAHKGIQGIAQALADIGDRRNKLLVIGTVTDRYLKEQLEAFGDWIALIPYQPFREMPALLRLADLICVFQDPNSEISKYQIPAKVTDALAMEIPCLATRVPPLEPLARAGAIETLEEESELAEKLEGLLAHYPAIKARSAEHRRVFLEEYSYNSVRPKLRKIIDQLVDDPPPLRAELKQVLDFQRDTFGRGIAPHAPGAHFEPNGGSVATPATVMRSSRAPGPRPAKRATDQYDLVFFWKQNDTGIYGRRQDMLVKYLALSERVRKVVHFDHPVDPRQLRAPSNVREAHHGRLVRRQTLLRLGGLKRDKNVAYHTFLHRPEDGQLSPMERVLPPRSEYPGYVASVLSRHGIGAEQTVFWVYPRNFDFPQLSELLSPDLVVADVMDDHRTWVEPGSRYHGQLTQNYEDILAASDVVLTNCESLRRIMSEFTDEIHVVPNACELPQRRNGQARLPKELRKLRRPIVGYVGNLSSRVDIRLLNTIARSRPDWSLVLVGSAHLDREVMSLDTHPNVTFLGVKPYDRARRLLAEFDVAIIPHLDNAMTQAMNPLKAFVYCAENVPVVSSPVANLSEMQQLIEIARGPDEFLKKLDAAIAAGRPAELSSLRREILEANCWERRVTDIIALLDNAV